MCLPWYAVLIESDKHCVMVLCVLVQRFLFSKMRYYLRCDKTLFYQVCVHSVHIGIGFGEYKILFLFSYDFLLRRAVLLRKNSISKQCLYSVSKGHSVMILHEFYRSAADLIFVVEPCAVRHSYTVMSAASVRVNELVFPSCPFKFFTSHTQIFRQINCICGHLLILCKWYIWHFLTPIKSPFPTICRKRT